MRKTGDERERRQAADFLDALRYWHMAAELYRAGQAIKEAEGRGEKETVKRLALQALKENEPVLKRVKSLPLRGWIRTADGSWENKNKLFSLPLLREKAEIVN